MNLISATSGKMLFYGIFATISIHFIFSQAFPLSNYAVSKPTHNATRIS